METLQATGNRTVAPIVLDNGLLLDGEAERGADGKYLIKSANGWERYFIERGKRTPTIGELVTGLRQSEQRQDYVALQGILQDLKESALCAGKMDYDKSNLPFGDGYLDELVKDSAWRRGLKDEIFHCDAPETISMLQRASGKRPYIWTPNASGRKSHPERAVWLYIITDRFYLDCLNNPIYGDGRARGVREVGAEGARAEKTGSAYRNSAMTGEERLDEQIREILSPYEQLKSSATAKLFTDITKKTVRELKELYKKQ